MLKRIINLSLKIAIYITAFLFGLSLNNKTSLFCMVLFVLTVLYVKKEGTFQVKISKYSLFILATLITYTLIDFLHNDALQQISITYLMLPLASYSTGYLAAKQKEKGTTIYHIIILCTAFGMFLFGILNIYKRYQAGYNDLWWIAAGRMCKNYWTDYDMWPTLAATYFLPISSLVFYMLVINKKIWLKILYVCALACTVWGALDIGSRAIIVAPFVMSMIFLILYLKSRSIRYYRKLSLVIKCLIVILVLGALYQSNTAGIRTVIENSNLYSRMTGKTYDSVKGLLDVNGRETRYYSIFDEMPTHPLGGINLGGNILKGGLGSAHNTWLDIYRVTGVIPFVLFIICTVMLFKRMRYLARHYTLFDLKMNPLLSVLIILNIEFLFESMFVANTQLLNFYFMLCGMADCFYLSTDHEPSLTIEGERSPA